MEIHVCRQNAKAVSIRLRNKELATNDTKTPLSALRSVTDRSRSSTELSLPQPLFESNP